MEQSSGSPNQNQSFPVYFGNVCLRFLPVLDIVVHRYLEISQVSSSLEILLEHLGCLYRFHGNIFLLHLYKLNFYIYFFKISLQILSDRPITYLYNTLHYYERKLRDQPVLKRRLVTAILESLKETISPGWGLTEAYQNISRPTSSEHLNSSEERKNDPILHWQPTLDYYVKLVQRLVESKCRTLKISALLL